MKYKTITLEPKRDALLTTQARNLLDKYYARGERSYQAIFARAAYCFSFGDAELAQNMYDYVSQLHLMFSSPIISNSYEGEWMVAPPFKDAFQQAQAEGKSPFDYWKGPKPNAMPIACFLSFLPDTIDGQLEASKEIAHLSILGGGTALHSRIRAVSDKAPGPIPYIKTIDGVMGYYRQGETRRGSTAIYVDINHPDIEEFINIRKPSGGDPARKIDNRAGTHHGVNITEEFVKAVEQDLPFDLVCPHTKEVRSTVKARKIWEQILETRELTGEPYLYFIDVANSQLPVSQKLLGLRNHGSNLCSEITLATSDERTAVCCLSSPNLEMFDDWGKTSMIEDLVRFLDNVIEWFIHFAPPSLHRAVRSAKAERAIGIGALGFHNYLMRKGIPFESGGFGSASNMNHRIFALMKAQARSASEQLASERGEPEDMKGTGRRNSHLFAIAPNANSSVICNSTPSVEPMMSNAYPQKSRAGITLVKNKYLENLLIALDKNTPEVWKDIIDHDGSVQHLNFLNEEQKAVFKTAWEIDQHWLVQHAEDRQEYICQAQSLNLFFAPGTDRAYINSVHLKAMRGRKVKSCYYFRTGSELTTDTVRTVERRPLAEWKQESEDCVSCQG